MTTQDEYLAATAAVQLLLQADLARPAPLYMRGRLTPDVVHSFAAHVAQVAVDAATKARAAPSKKS